MLVQVLERATCKTNKHEKCAVRVIENALVQCPKGNLQHKQTQERAVRMIEKAICQKPTLGKALITHHVIRILQLSHIKNLT